MRFSRPFVVLLAISLCVAGGILLASNSARESDSQATDQTAVYYDFGTTLSFTTDWVVHQLTPDGRIEIPASPEQLASLQEQARGLGTGTHENSSVQWPAARWEQRPRDVLRMSPEGIAELLQRGQLRSVPPAPPAPSQPHLVLWIEPDGSATIGTVEERAMSHELVQNPEVRAAIAMTRWQGSIVSSRRVSKYWAALGSQDPVAALRGSGGPPASYQGGAIVLEETEMGQALVQFTNGMTENQSGKRLVAEAKVDGSLLIWVEP